jgi:hypothetical protein
MPRFGIAGIMGLVALVALEIGAVRAVYHDYSPDHGPWRLSISNRTRTQREMLIRGTLPMANILAIGLMIGHRRRSSQPFFVGFMAVGGLALFVYSGWAWFVFPRHYLYNDLSHLIQHHWLIPEFIGSRHALRQIATSILLVGPQLAMAMVGGFVSRKLQGKPFEGAKPA